MKMKRLCCCFLFNFCKRNAKSFLLKIFILFYVFPLCRIGVSTYIISIWLEFLFHFFCSLICLTLTRTYSNISKPFWNLSVLWKCRWEGYAATTQLIFYEFQLRLSIWNSLSNEVKYKKLINRSLFLFLSMASLVCLLWWYKLKTFTITILYKMNDEIFSFFFK